MSRIGKKPVPVPEGVNVAIANRTVKVTGPKGELSFETPDSIQATYAEEARQVSVSRQGDGHGTRALHGMARSVISGMITGVSQGFEKQLLIFGTGYGCNLVGQQLHLNCGFMGTKMQPAFSKP